MKIFDEIIAILPEIEKSLEKEEGKVDLISYSDLLKYHFSLGVWIRNTFLGSDSILFKEFVKNGVRHRDDQTQVILIFFYFYMREKYT